MNKHTNFLAALIGGASCTQQEVQDGLSALKAAGTYLESVNTQADGKFHCGRNTEWVRGSARVRSSAYILTPSYVVQGDGDSKNAGEMGVFCTGRMDDRDGGLRIDRGRYHVEIKDAFLVLAGVVIEDSEIYKEDLIPQIIGRINAPKVENIAPSEIEQEQEIVAYVGLSDEELKAARKAAKQAEKAAKIAAKKGR